MNLKMKNMISKIYPYSIKVVQVLHLKFLFIVVVILVSKSTFSQLDGNSLQLQADANYISIKDASSASLSTNMTWEFWVYNCCENETKGQTYISKGWCPEFWSYYIINDNGFLVFEKFNYGGSSDDCNSRPVAEYRSSTSIIPFNTWTHIAIVMSGTTVQFYKNSQPVSTTLISGLPFVGIRTTTRPILIGSYQFIGGNYGSTPIGNIDDVRIWHTARTANQIAKNYQSELTGNESGLAAYYKLNEAGSGKGITVINSANGSIMPNGKTVGSAANISFQDNNTVINITPNCNVQQKPGSGNALHFNGTNQNVDVNASFIYQVFTIDMWIKPGATQMQYAAILDNNHNNNRSIVLQQNGSNTNQYYFGGSQGAFTQTIPFNLKANIWQHIALVSTKTKKLVYVNGILINSQSSTDTIKYDGTQFLRFARWGGGGRYWNGIMDEVRIWNVALTQDQIRDRMCHKIRVSDPLYSNLNLYYNFDESSGSDAYDGSLNISNATLVNSPDRVLSGAPIGNASTYTYGGNSVKLKNSDSENIKIDKIKGSPEGMHLYRVDNTPSIKKGIKGLGPNKTYFGAFPLAGSSVKYRVTYTYTGNPYVIQTNEDSLKLYIRTSNADNTWENANANLDTGKNAILTNTDSSTEYILGSTGEPLQVPKSVAINDTVVKEGNNGTRTLKIPIRLNKAAVFNSSVNYATADSTAAIADDDYVSKSGIVNFAVGQLTDTIKISIKGDIKVEPDEIFKVMLSEPKNISIADTNALITIKNDDSTSLSVAKTEEINSVLKHESFDVSPNPARDFINITSFNSVNNAEITIRTLSGQILYTTKQNFSEGQQLKINLSKISKQFLIVNIKVNNENKQFKIMLL